MTETKRETSMSVISHPIDYIYIDADGREEENGHSVKKSSTMPVKV